MASYASHTPGVYSAYGTVRDCAIGSTLPMDSLDTAPGTGARTKVRSTLVQHPFQWCCILSVRIGEPNRFTYEYTKVALATCS